MTNEVESKGFEAIDKVRVADIQFSYKNGSLINLLKKRGEHVKNNNWPALKKINEELDKIKTKEYQNLIVPVGAFVTFESEEGLQRCLTLKDKESQVTVLGRKPEIKEAPEPTNIIWENRQFSFVQRFLRAILAVAVIAILLSISFSIIVSLKSKARTAKYKY